MHKLSRYRQWSQWPRPNFHHILLRSSLSKWIADISRMPKIIQSWQLWLEGTGIQRIQQHFGTSRNRKIKYKSIYIFKSSFSLDVITFDRGWGRIYFFFWLGANCDKYQQFSLSCRMPGQTKLDCLHMNQVAFPFYL